MKYEMALRVLGFVVMAGDTVSCWIHALISSAEFVEYSHQPSQLIELGRGGDLERTESKEESEYTWVIE